jgi:hypothetical protein
MKLHANARLSVKGRELLVDRILMQGWSLAQAAEAAGVSDRTAASGCGAIARRGRLDWLTVPQSPCVSPLARLKIAWRRSLRCAAFA